MAGIDMEAVRPWTTGESLLPLSNGEARTNPVLMEYAAEGSYAPLVAVREGRYKFIRCVLDPDQLYDLESDPHELDNLAVDPAHSELVEQMQKQVQARWDFERFDAEVRRSQARRLVVYDALRSGAYYPWDYQPLQKASERYMRNHMDLNVLEDSQRVPRGE